ncbi:MAG: hypothetical protein MUF22_05975 [Chitinispirillaceae bacterium]|jgi:hypothetical protein|nr:hypothetical protein [Chitinispirillaceae bacterium]
MRSGQYWCFSVLTLLSVLSLRCSQFDDSTSLGKSIVEGVDGNSDKLNVRKHFREYVMDSAVGALFNTPGTSLPGADAAGFGRHSAGTSVMVIGTQGDETAAGFIDFVPNTDTAGTRRIPATDTLLSVKVRFFRDSTPVADRIALRTCDSIWDPNSPSAGSGDSIIDTVVFPAAKAAADTITLPLWLADSIFRACTSAVPGTLRARVIFSLVRIDSGAGLIRVNGNTSVIVSTKRGSETKQVVYDRDAARNNLKASVDSYYLASDGNDPVFRTLPRISYASKRTAVFAYSLQGLWNTASAGVADAMREEIIAATFSLRGHSAADTVKLSFLLLDHMVSDGATLDTLFSIKNVSDRSVAIAGTAVAHLNVQPELSAFEKKTSRPLTAYLYLRMQEDDRQVWKSTVWQNVPLLKAVITVP